MRFGRRFTLSSLVALALASGCAQTDFGDELLGGGDTNGPGTWDDDISCEVDGDCAQGEICQDAVCQMARCKDGPYDSQAPLGGGMYFFLDREMVVADSTPSQGEYYVDGYAPSPSGVQYPGSWTLGPAPIVDVAGGDLLGSRPEQFVIATEGSTRVEIAGTNVSVDVGFQPVALGVGDVDRDRLDEVVVLGQFGNVALCDLDGDPSCDMFVIENGNGIDVAVADVDGDLYAEPVLLLDAGGTPTFYVWNTDVDVTGHEDVVAFSEHAISRLDGGDLDGDGVAELVAFEDDGLLNSAMVYTMRVTDEGVSDLGQKQVDAGAVDLAVADLDQDNASEVAVLRDGATLEIFRAGNPGELLSQWVGGLPKSATPNRIAMSDFDGDSPAASLASLEPDLILGNVVPSMVLHFPPYDAERSSETSYLFVGESEQTSEALTDAVTLSVGVDVGVSAGLAGIFKASLSAGISKEILEFQTQERAMTIGDRYVIKPDAEINGFDYGAVVLHCGCFHAWTYDVEDPSGSLGGDGEQFVVLLPVDGQTTVWSSNRYNAMAEAVDYLPRVEVPYTIGDPSSYSDAPQKPDGSPILTEDFVFPEVPNYLVSDTSKVGWWLSVSEHETNETLAFTKLEMEGSVNVGGFQFGGHLGTGYGEGYRISVGQEALFGGGVPPIPDDPDTPDDEYANYAFAFSPYVYRDYYTDAAGNDAGYYVMSFAVGR